MENNDSIIKRNLITQHVVNEYLEERDIEPHKVEEINPEDIFIVNSVGDILSYGNVNDIIESKEFKEWMKERRINIMENNLKLLSLAKDFDVTYISDKSYYNITYKSTKLVARIYPKENKVEYGMIVGDIYYDEFVKIDMDKLNKLQEFCELLMKESE